MAIANADALRFFNRLSGFLNVELTEPSHPVNERLLNRIAPSGARVTSVQIAWQVYENEGFRELSPEEWSAVVLDGPTLRMRGAGDLVIEHAANSSGVFTVRDLADAVAETERQSRGRSDWFGGVDVHHRFFEGIRLDGDGVWQIRWGS